MNDFTFLFAGIELTLLGSGALWWSDAATLCVSDLHLGKSERIARLGGAMLPPYETQDTLGRLESDIQRTEARTVICLGDSFDDLAAAENMDDAGALWLNRLMAGRNWIWIEGNHDPGPVAFGGSHLAEFSATPLVFRHIAHGTETGEISGHFHPKARVSVRNRSISRPCLLFDLNKVIMPAYGSFTGGLRSDTAVLADMMGDDAVAVLLGDTPRAIPMPRG